MENLMGCAAARMRRLLVDRENWINTKLKMLGEVPPSHILGETILFRGEIISVQQIQKLQKKLEKSQKSTDIKKYYTRFYHDESLLTLPSRIRHYAQKMDLQPSEIRYKSLRRRWGSCDSNGVLTFNVMMMQLSYRHIDYIIVHELAHMRHMNHSKVFHDLVRTIGIENILFYRYPEEILTLLQTNDFHFALVAGADKSILNPMRSSMRQLGFEF